MSTSAILGAAAGSFSDYSIQKAINRALADIPEGHTFALVAHVDDVEGASLTAVAKIGDEWKVEASVVKGWNQPFRYGAQVVWSR